MTFSKESAMELIAPDLASLGIYISCGGNALKRAPIVTQVLMVSQDFYLYTKEPDVLNSLISRDIF